MRLQVRDAPPPGKSLSIAFLHEAADPSSGAPDSVRAAVGNACRAAGFRGREKESSGALTVRGGWLLVGLGKPSAPFGKLRRALRRTLRAALQQSPRRLLFALGRGIGERRVRAILRELAQADYRFDRYKSKGEPSRRTGPIAAVVLPPPGTKAARFQDDARQAEVLARAVGWARDLGNTPANDLGPADFAREARAMGRREGLRIRALGKRQIQKVKQ